MRKFLIPLAVAAAFGSSISAYAADTMTTGVVKSVDAKSMTITLEDGTAYNWPTGFKDPGLKAGDKVTVGWQMANSKHQADTIVMVK